MEIKDFNQAIKRQEELSAKLMTRIERLCRKKEPSIAATVEEQEELIVQAKMALEASKKEKELALRRWSRRVRQRKAALTRLEKALEKIRT